MWVFVLAGVREVEMYARFFYTKKSHTESDHTEGMRGGNVCEIFLYKEVAYRKRSGGGYESLKCMRIISIRRSRIQKVVRQRVQEPEMYAKNSYTKKSHTISRQTKVKMVDRTRNVPEMTAWT